MSISSNANGPLPASTPNPSFPEALKNHLATTPGRLKLAMVIVGLGCFVFWSVARVSVQATRQGLQTLGKDAAPSVVLAQKIKTSLADLDANAANHFLEAEGGAHTARTAFLKDRDDVSDRVVSAAQNITYGDEERVPIKTMVEGLQTYAASADSALALRSSDYHGAASQYFGASKFLHETLLPAADALSDANDKHLEEGWKSCQNSAAARVAVTIAASVVLAVILVLTQIYLARRMRRILNVPLVLATLLVLGFSLWMTARLVSANSALRAAKEDAFDSVHALWKARAVAYDANGDESLYLIETAWRPRFEETFHQKAALLVDSPTTTQLLEDAENDKIEFKGFLGAELRNITFPGEKRAALDTLQGFALYMNIDRKIRALEMAGRHDEAIAVCTGYNPGQSNWAFEQFDKALGLTLDINQQEFDKDITRAFGDLAGLEGWAAAVAVAAAFLTIIGILPRLAEYRG